MKQDRYRNLSREKGLAELTPDEDALAETILAEMVSGDAAFVERIKGIANPALALALIERVPHRDERAVPLLSEIRKSFPDKEVQKAVKRVLFRMKQAGVPVVNLYEKEDQEVPILKPVQRPEPVARCSVPYGWEGTRAVIVEVPLRGRIWELVAAMVSPDQGFLEVMSATLERGNSHEVAKQLSQQFGTLFETSLSHAMVLLEGARNRNLALGKEIPADYASRRLILQRLAPAPSLPNVWDMLSVAEEADYPLAKDEMTWLLNQPIMENWIIDYQELVPLMQGLVDVEASPLLLSPAQKFQRATDIQKKVTEQIFTPQRRQASKMRFQEMAYAFLKSEEPENALLCLKASVVVQKEDSDFFMNPVLHALVERSMGYYMTLNRQRAEKEKETSSLILNTR